MIMSDSFKTLVILGVLLLPKQILTQAHTDERSEGPPLILRGQVLESRMEPSPVPSEFAILVVKIRVDFVSRGKVPVIFLTDSLPGVLEVTLTKNPDPVNDENVLYHEPGGESLSEEAEWRRLRSELDRPTLPRNRVAVIQPGEKWVMETELWLRPDTITVWGVPSSLAILKNAPSLFLRVEYLFWPYIIEKPPYRADRPFGHKLQKRWRAYGMLQLEPIVSEPMPLKLPDAPPSNQ